MDIKKCLEILELDRHASIAETKRAYKDIASVWHPDRFSHNPRLKRKAEEKLKEINIAYETLMAYLSSNQALGTGHNMASHTRAEGRHKSEAGKRPGAKSERVVGRKEGEVRDRTEAIAEAGTRIALSLWSFFATRLRQMAESQGLDGGADRKGKKGDL